ncbi:MAG TPA: TolC family protein [Polyangiaceae bacterium]|nr:TolC family protein [Polyangiaceae bacterium]
MTLLATSSSCYAPTRWSLQDVSARDAARLEPPPPFGARELSLARALRRAKTQSLEIAARRAELAARSTAIDAADRIDNPELRVGQTRLDDLMQGAPEVEVKLRVKPPRPIENDARRAEAEAEARAAEADLRGAERDVLAATKRDYVEASSLSRSIATAETIAGLFRRRARLLEERLQAGGATALDVAHASVDSARADDTLADLRVERHEALNRLGDRIGASLADEVVLDAIDAQRLLTQPLPDEADVSRRAIASAPEVSRSAAEVDAAAARADVERSGRWPWVSFLELGYDFSQSTVDPQGFTFGAGLVVPVFDTRSAAVDAAEAERTARARRADAEAAGAAERARRSLREVAARRDELERSTQLLEASSKAVAAADASLVAGQLDELAAISAAIDDARLQLDHDDRLRRLVLAASELERLTGIATVL